MSEQTRDRPTHSGRLLASRLGAFLLLTILLAADLISLAPYGNIGVFARRLGFDLRGLNADVWSDCLLDGYSLTWWGRSTYLRLSLDGKTTSPNTWQRDLFALPGDELLTQSVGWHMWIELAPEEHGWLHSIRRDTHLVLLAVPPGTNAYYWPPLRRGTSELPPDIHAACNKSLSNLTTSRTLTLDQSEALRKRGYWQGTSTRFGGVARDGLFVGMLICWLLSLRWIATAAGLTIRLARRKAVLRSGRCPNCTYAVADIRPNDAGHRICPECGGSFAADPGSFSVYSPELAHQYAEDARRESAQDFERRH